MNRILRLLSVAFALTLAACGGGNSEVTVKGNTLKPKSAEFWSGPVFEGLPFEVTTVIVHDIEGLCGKLGGIGGDSCSGPSGDLFDPAAFAENEATAMILFKLGTSEGESKVGPSGEFATAGLQFLAVRDGKPVVTEEAVSGTIAFDDFKKGERVSGSYDVVLSDGTAIKGTFEASHCSNFGQVFKMTEGEDMICNSPYSTDLECSDTCSCGKRTNSVSCTRNDEGEDWTCTCSVGGKDSTCTVPAAATKACVPPEKAGQGCCPDVYEF